MIFPRGRAALVFPAVVALAVLLGSSLFALRLLAPGQKRQIDRSGPTILQALSDLSAYRAATGTFQVIVDEEEDITQVPAFLAGERTVLVAAGSVDAEVDFSSLDQDTVVVSPDRRQVTIKLPPAQLTQARLDHEHTYVASRQRGIVNRVGEALSASPGDDRELLLQAENKLRDTAADTELRTRAENNTRSMLTTLLRSLGFDRVDITFAESPA